MTDDLLCLCAHELPSSPPLVAFLVDDYQQAHALLLVLLDIDHPRATIIHPGSRVKRLRRERERERERARERTSEGALSLVRKPALQERRGRGRGVSVGRACVRACCCSCDLMPTFVFAMWCWSLHRSTIFNLLFWFLFSSVSRVSGRWWEEMEFLWPFLICIFMVTSFLVVGIAILCRYEGGKVSGPRLEQLEDPSIVGILPIGYLCREELWMSCGGAVRPELLLVFRALAVAYLLPQLLYNIVKDGVSGYFFYTQWTFTLLILYFSLALRVSVNHFVNEKFNRSLPARIESPDFGDEQLMPDEDDEVEGAGVRSILQNAKDRTTEQGKGQLPFAPGRGEKLEDAGICSFPSHKTPF